MKTKDYHDLYLNSNIILLAEVFEKFRNKKIMVCVSQSLFECISFKLGCNA